MYDDMNITMIISPLVIDIYHQFRSTGRQAIIYTYTFTITSLVSTSITLAINNGQAAPMRLPWKLGQT